MRVSLQQCEERTWGQTILKALCRACDAIRGLHQPYTIFLQVIEGYILGFSVWSSLWGIPLGMEQLYFVTV
jgi:hypothetical protein